MSSSVTLVQGTTISITTVECTDVAVLAGSPTLASAVLDCIARDITVTGGQATEIDTTTLCSTAKEFRLGLQDSGTMSITGHWVQGHAGHIAIKDAAADKKARGIEVTFSDGTIFRCIAFVSQRSWSAAVDGVVTGTFNFRLTGATSETTT